MNSGLFITGYGRRVPQPRLFVLEEALGESGWLKALKREEDAPRVPRGTEHSSRSCSRTWMPCSRAIPTAGVASGVHLAELVSVADRPACPTERPVSELCDHEVFVRAVLVAQRPRARPLEAETGVVAGFSQDHRCGVAGLAAGFQPIADEARADALTLVFGQHRDGGQPYHPRRVVPTRVEQFDRREEHVSHDAAVGFRRSDQGDRRGVRGVQRLDQARLILAVPERSQMYLMDGQGILVTVRTDLFSQRRSLPEKSLFGIPETVRGKRPRPPKAQSYTTATYRRRRGAPAGSHSARAMHGFWLGPRPSPDFESEPYPFVDRFDEYKTRSTWR
jgi:hypothetical protein